MVYSTIEVVGIILAVLTVLKIGAIYLFPGAARKMSKRFVSKKIWYNFYSYVALAAFLVLFYFLLQTMSIFQVLVSVTMGALLMFVWMAAYPTKTRALIKEAIKDPHKAWFCYLVYMIIALWVLWLVLM